MSDRVRYLGVFPSLPNTGATGNLFPASIGAEQANAWYWRVKNWAIFATMSVSAGTSTQSIDSGTMTAVGATTEKELVESPVRLFFGGSVTSTGPGPFPPGSSVNLVLFDVETPGDPFPGYREGATLGEYRPGIRIVGSIGVFDGAGADVFFDSDVDALGVAPTGSFIATVDGVSVTVYYVANGSVSVGGLDFTPEEYWPYAGADAAPINDTTTGDLLPGRTALD